MNGIDAMIAAEGLPADYRDGWTFVTPVIEMPVYLRWLTARVEALGGTLTRMNLPGLPEAELVQTVSEMLDLAFSPEVAAWELRSNGDWERTGGDVQYQEKLIERQRRRRTTV